MVGEGRKKLEVFHLVTVKTSKWVNKTADVPLLYTLLPRAGILVSLRGWQISQNHLLWSCQLSVYLRKFWSQVSTTLTNGNENVELDLLTATKYNDFVNKWIIFILTKQFLFHKSFNSKQRRVCIRCPIFWLEDYLIISDFLLRGCWKQSAQVMKILNDSKWFWHWIWWFATYE